MLDYLHQTRGVRAPQQLSNLRMISQEQFMPENATLESTGMWRSAFLYTPAECATSTKCGVHVFYHGCKVFDWEVYHKESAARTEEGMRRAFVEYAGEGFNRWAEANHLQILYPMAGTGLCWDWTGDNSAVKNSLFNTKANL